MSENRTNTDYPPEQYPYRIKNWDKFQYYRFRRPPWIRLHVSTLQSEDWVMLDDLGKLLMLALMMIASQHDGHLPAIVDNPDYLKRVLNLNHPPKIKPLIDRGFLVKVHASACNGMLPHASASQSTETETERVLSPIRKSARTKKKFDYTADFESFWQSYPDRTNNSKPAAFEKWAALSEPERQAAAAAIPAFVAYCRSNPDYRVVHCERFLGQRRFESFGGPALVQVGRFKV